jgi:hypothetical protein
MSLDAWEERALNSIAADLAASAPELASRLSVFNRLTSGEQMPEDLQAKAEGRRGHHGARPRRRHRRVRADRMKGSRTRTAHDGTWPVTPAVAFLAVITGIVIALAVVLNATSHQSGGTRGNGHYAQTRPTPCCGR